MPVDPKTMTAKELADAYKIGFHSPICKSQFALIKHAYALSLLVGLLEDVTYQPVRNRITALVGTELINSQNASGDMAEHMAEIGDISFPSVEIPPFTKT